MAAGFHTQSLADVIVKDELAARPFMSNLGPPISFKRAGGGTFAPASGTIAAVTGPTMQVIDLNGDQQDDLALATRIVDPCAPATTGEAGVFSQFEDLGDGGPLVAVDVTGDQKPDLLRINGTELKVRVHR